jgi:hypothetical protein
MSLTSYRAAPPRVRDRARGTGKRVRSVSRLGCTAVGGPGGDLLSHVLRRSTIGAGGFHGRVRDGIGCWAPRHDHQAGRPRCGVDVVTRDREGGGKAHRPVAWSGLPLRAALMGWDQADRAISKAQLHALLRVHMPPIDVMVCHGSRGMLVSRRVSRLDAFSGYPVRT